MICVLLIMGGIATVAGLMGAAIVTGIRRVVQW
jgi:hypothetical protein